MTKTRKAAIGLIAGGLALVLILITVFAVSAQKNKPDSLTELRLSISYLDGKFQFTIPDTSDSWNIQICGRVVTNGYNGMSVHYLEEENESSSWERGKTYSFEVDGSYTELYLNASNEQGDIAVNLMDRLPGDLKAII